MKTLNPLFRTTAAMGLSLVFATAVWFPLCAHAADNPRSPQSQSILKQRQEWAAQREKMLTQAKAEDAALAKLVAELKQAPEANKVDVLANIVTRLVADRHERLSEWESMHAQMTRFWKENHATAASSTSSSSGLNHTASGSAATARK